MEIHPPDFAVGDDKKKEREGKGRYTKSQVGYSATWGADPFGLISMKFGKVVGVHDTIIQAKFRFNIFSGGRSTGGSRFPFPH